MATPKIEKVEYRNSRQENIAKSIIKVLRAFTQEDVEKYKGQILAIIDSPALKTEEWIAFPKTGPSPYTGKVRDFITKAEFWVRTAFLKLTDEQLAELIKLSVIMQKNGVCADEIILAFLQKQPHKEAYAKPLAKEEKEEAKRKVHEKPVIDFALLDSDEATSATKVPDAEVGLNMDNF